MQYNQVLLVYVYKAVTMRPLESGLLSLPENAMVHQETHSVEWVKHKCVEFTTSLYTCTGIYTHFTYVHVYTQ